MLTLIQGVGFIFLLLCYFGALIMVKMVMLDIPQSDSTSRKRVMQQKEQEEPDNKMRRTTTRIEDARIIEKQIQQRAAVFAHRHQSC